MDELIDIVTLDGQPTGTVCLKSDAHQNGFLHASVHIWLYTKKGTILVQKRSKTKDLFPDLWDISVAGHIAANEKPIIAALREIKEEIGCSLNQKDLNYKNTWIEKHKHSNGMIDHEVHHIYLAEITNDITKLTLQKEEVSDVQFISLEKLEKEVAQQATFVPHDAKYYKHIIDLLKAQISHGY